MFDTLRFLSQMFLWSISTLTFLAYPSFAQQIVQVDNQSPNTLFHTGGDSWGPPLNNREIGHENWTRTAIGGRVDLHVLSQNVIYLQSGSTNSQVWLPIGEKCTFKHDGGSIKLHPSRNSGLDECDILTGIIIIGCCC